MDFDEMVDDFLEVHQMNPLSGRAQKADGDD